MLTPIILGIFIFFAVGLILYFVIVYNGFIALSKNIDKAWSNIDVLLKQRHDEIPNLIKTCKAYMQYEQSLLDNLTKARAACLNSSGIKEMSVTEGNLGGVLNNFFAVVENYPDLKANQNFLQLQQRISHLENQIADRREFFNDSVNSYNIRIAQIPDVFIAHIFNMQAKDLFEVSETDRKEVKI